MSCTFQNYLELSTALLVEITNIIPGKIVENSSLKKPACSKTVKSSKKAKPKHPKKKTRAVAHNAIPTAKKTAKFVQKRAVKVYSLPDVTERSSISDLELPSADVSLSSPSITSSSTPSSSEGISIISDVNQYSQELPLKKQFPYEYAPRVREWFKSNPSHLDRIETYQRLSPKLKTLQHLFHGFSRTVDNYIFEYGHKSIWVNSKRGTEDQVYSVAGSIEIGSKRLWGLFRYAIGSGDNQIYHRYFTNTPPTELLHGARTSFKQLTQIDNDDESEFIHEESSPSAERVRNWDPATRHRVFNTIHIADPAFAARITLLPKYQ